MAAARRGKILGLTLWGAVGGPGGGPRGSRDSAAPCGPRLGLGPRAGGGGDHPGKRFRSGLVLSGGGKADGSGAAPSRCCSAVLSVGGVRPRAAGRLLPSHGRRPARRRRPAVHGPRGVGPRARCGGPRALRPECAGDRGRPRQLHAPESDGPVRLEARAEACHGPGSPCRSRRQLRVQDRAPVRMPGSAGVWWHLPVGLPLLVPILPGPPGSPPSPRHVQH